MFQDLIFKHNLNKHVLELFSPRTFSLLGQNFIKTGHASIIKMLLLYISF